MGLKHPASFVCVSLERESHTEENKNLASGMTYAKLANSEPFDTDSSPKVRGSWWFVFNVHIAI